MDEQMDERKGGGAECKGTSWEERELNPHIPELKVSRLWLKIKNQD